MGVSGDIHRYGLEDWWYSAFTQSERSQIADVYRPLGTTGRPLVEGNTQRQKELHASPFLATLANWTAKPELGDIALRIAEEAASFDEPPNDLVQAHFMYANLCKVFYRYRDLTTSALGQAVWACEQDIAVSNRLDPSKIADGAGVSHYCFKQLAIIEEKRGNFDRAIQLCQQAARQGWHGDWDKREARLRRRLAKEAEDS